MFCFSFFGKSFSSSSPFKRGVYYIYTHTKQKILLLLFFFFPLTLLLVFAFPDVSFRIIIRNTWDCEWKRVIQKASSIGFVSSAAATRVIEKFLAMLLLIWEMNWLVSFYILDCDCVSCSSLIALLENVPLFSYPTIHWVFVRSHLVVLISMFPIYMNYRCKGRLIWCTVEEVLG